MSRTSPPRSDLYRIPATPQGVDRWAPLGMKEGVQSDDVQSYKIDIKEGVCKIGRLEGVQKVPVFMICQQELEIVKFI